MTDKTRDPLKRATTIDKAKESGRYDQATVEAIEKLRSLSSGNMAELDAHPLADIYVQELVRCEAIRQMKEGSFRDARQLARYLQELLSRELGPGVAKDLSRLVVRWVQAFKTQLGDASEVTQRKNALDQVTGESWRRSYPAPLLDDLATKSSQGRYRLEIQPRSEGAFALEGTPLYGQLDARRFAKVFGPEFAVGFPIEVNSEGHTFLLDFDGSILIYGREETWEQLMTAAELLTHRLERCFAG